MLNTSDMEENVTLLRVPRSVNKRPWKIISGGQTGVDRAGIVAAMSYCIPFGGWVPKGRLAEDGVVPENFYALRECDGGYRERTRANVDSADATLILVDGLPLSGGTAYTAEYAAKRGKPCKAVDNGSGGDICQIDDDGSLCGWISSDWIGE